MKKFIYTLLATLFLFSLTACSATNEESNPTMKELENVAEQFEEVVDIIASMDEKSSKEEEELKKCCACGATSGVEYIMENWTYDNTVCLDCFTKYSACDECKDTSKDSSYREDFDKYYCDECYTNNQICVICSSKDATYRGRYYKCDKCYEQYG